MSADLLRAAAIKLRETAEAALEDLRTNRYWSGYPKPSAWHDGMTNGLGGPSGDFAALMNPALAEPLAAWFEDAAADMTTEWRTEPETSSEQWALTVARAILGAAA